MHGTYIHMYSTYTHMYIHTYIHMYIHTYVCTYILADVYTCTCVYVHTLFMHKELPRFQPHGGATVKVTAPKKKLTYVGTWGLWEIRMHFPPKWLHSQRKLALNIFLGSRFKSEEEKLFSAIQRSKLKNAYVCNVCALVRHVCRYIWMCAIV
jgi:hypothetical protein